jgi:DNA-binding GntR family transcriptional regulator
MRTSVIEEDFGRYYQLNLAFHDVYLELSDNQELKRTIDPIKQRLYDFPRRSYLKDWELHNCDEHQQFIDLVRKGDRDGAAGMMRDVHWSYEVQEKYIVRFYSRVGERIRAELASAL